LYSQVLHPDNLNKVQNPVGFFVPFCENLLNLRYLRAFGSPYNTLFLSCRGVHAGRPCGVSKKKAYLCAHYCFVMKKFSITFLFLLTVAQLAAVTADPTPVKKVQPDGTEITVRLRGDERVHWMETLDGYTLMYDAQKYIVYATTDAAGQMVPSTVRYRGASAAAMAPAARAFVSALPKGIRYSAAQVATLKQIRQVTDDMQAQAAPVTGMRKALCVLMEFKDKPMVKSKAEFENLMNQVGYSAGGAKGSVRDFYLENSYGLLDLNIVVAGPYTTSGNVASYVSDAGNRQFAREAAQAANADIDYTEFAVNGRLETFHIIFAGHGDEAIQDGQQIWSHKWQLTAPITLDGVQISVYSCSPELRGASGSNLTYIGVICHELCHVFGAPDYYDTNYATNGDFDGTGSWDLMANGSWNDGGRNPAHINMFQKILYGWVTPVPLNGPTEVHNMLNSAKNAVAYTIEAHSNGELYVLENRQRVGFDANVPGHGLLIYHVHQNALGGNANNDRHPQQVYPVCATASSQKPTDTPSSYGNINSGGCPFPGTGNRTSFTDNTTPMAFSWATGSGIAKPITRITEAGGEISFDFMNRIDPVTHLQATANSHTATLTWTAPADPELTGFKIYRNDQLIYTISDTAHTTFTQSRLANGTYSYCVVATDVYNFESDRVCKTVNITNGNTDVCAPVPSVASTLSHGNRVTLAWPAPAEANVVHYNIYRNDVPTGTAPARSYTDETAGINTTYCYCVTAQYASGCESEQTCAEVMTKEEPTLQSVSVNGVPLDMPDDGSSTLHYIAACNESEMTLDCTSSGTLSININGQTYTNGASVPFTGDRTPVTLRIVASSGTTTYILFVARALGADRPMYIQRWGKALAIINNPNNNGGYQFDDCRWYRTGQASVVGTGEYILCNDAPPSDYYAEVHNVATAEWHRVCKNMANETLEATTVYPNPVAAGQPVYVQLPEGVAEATVRIFDMSGNLVRQEFGVRHQVTAPRQPGIFLLHLAWLDGHTTQRILVN
jgi:M6 family metalloprotease-like protein